MRKFFAIVLMFLFIATPIAIVHADDTTTSEDVASYRLQVGDKAARGAKNVLFGWTELPKRVVDLSKETNPVWGVIAGTFQGTLRAFARTASGAVDVVTAPIDADKDPLMQADISAE